MPKYEFDTRPFRAHQRIMDLVGRGHKVLEVGCSTGYISKRLRANDCEVVGLEVDEESAKEAKDVCDEVIIADVEAIEGIPYPDKYFDLLLFGDVLEHLRDPLGVLLKLSKWLKDDGHAICSIPNVAHVYVRLKLLLGKWDYKETGILDRTHLRFYNLKSAKKLLEDAGFCIDQIDYSPWIPLFRLRKYQRWAAVEYWLARLRPTLFAFQFIIKAVKEVEGSEGYHHHP